MSMRIVGVSGNLGRPSKTRALVETIVGQAAGVLDARGIVYDVSELAPSLGGATRIAELAPTARSALEQVIRADAPRGREPGLQGQLHRAVQASLRPAPTGGPRRQAGHARGDRRRRPACAGDRAPAPAALRLLRGGDPADRVYASERDFTDGVPVSRRRSSNASRAPSNSSGCTSPESEPDRREPSGTLAARWPGGWRTRDPRRRSPAGRDSSRASIQHQGTIPMTRQIKLGAFLPGGGQHIAAWRHPDSPADGATSFEFHRQLAADRRARASSTPTSSPTACRSAFGGGTRAATPRSPASSR